MEDLDTPGGRLKWARENKTTFKSATAAAEAFGWTVSTYLGHENGDRTPKRTTAKKYAAAYKVPWEWILEGGPLPGRRTRAGPIPTIGAVAAGLWLDIDGEVDPRDLEQFPITAHPDYPSDAQYGLIVRGTSINRIADAGEVLHCVDVIKAQIDTHEGDIVIVERKRAQGSQREVTAKRITKRGKIVVLMPDSSEARWKPIEFDPSNKTDEEEVAVIGLVVGVYRPFRRRSVRG